MIAINNFLMGRGVITDDCNVSQMKTIYPPPPPPKDVSVYTGSKLKDAPFNSVNLFL